jgi:hypothetical protein
MDPTAGEPVFRIQQSSKKIESWVPKIFLTFAMTPTYHLRAYIYQARDILAGDDTGLSDPFCNVAFLSHSQSTEKQFKTLSPTWDQTLIFEEISIPGNPEMIRSFPPGVTIEIFDWDTVGKPDFLGRTTATPMVKLLPEEFPTPPRLQWYDLKRNGCDAGRLLATFELYLLQDGASLPYPPPMRGDIFRRVPRSGGPC